MLMKMFFVYAVTVATVALRMPLVVDSAYTYQKLNELLPELRQYLGRTHLGTLKARQFYNDDGPSFQQVRERKSNNLRNLMRIGKRIMPMPASSTENGGADSPFNSVYYSPKKFIQSFRPQSVWLRR